ncbi:MAG: phosphatase PAP2 family protein [Erythrobacter sp.]
MCDTDSGLSASKNTRSGSVEATLDGATVLQRPAASNAKVLTKLLLTNVGRAEISICVLATFISFVCFSLLYSNGIEVYPALAFSLNFRFLSTIFALIVIAELVFLFAVHRPVNPFQFLMHDDAVKALLRRIVPGVMMAMCLALFMPAFAQVKSSIPMLTDYTWDATFILWDQSLHGTDPWRILQPLLGYPAITAFLGQLYHVWFALIHLCPLCIAMYVSNDETRLRFFMGYFLTWTCVGMIGAIALASVGPVFLEPLIGNSHFAEQMAYLKSANEITTNPVIEVQNALLDWYFAGEHGLGRGITAMPSMHVALCTLYVFAMWELDKRLGIAFAIYWTIIAVSSVHLAYHYAVDGYVSAVLVAAIWFFTKPAARSILASGKSGERVGQEGR